MIDAVFVSWFKHMSAQFGQYFTHILSALCILVIGAVIARSASFLISKRLKCVRGDKTLHMFLAKLLYWVIWLVVIVAVLSKLGVQTASLIAVMGALSLAIGLSLKSSLSNLASGLLLVFFKPFKVGDFIRLGSISGTVTEIEILFTHLKTSQNEAVCMPNSRVLGGDIINNSKFEKRRIDLIIGIGYEDDIDHARQVILDVIAKDSRVQTEAGTPVVLVTELADSSVNLAVRLWALQKDYGLLRCDLLEALKKKLDQEKINMPYPTQDIYIHQD